MDTKYKRHQKVKLLRAPLVDDVEYYTEPPTDIKEGMNGKINLILPNGQYHVEIHDTKGNTIAYIAMDEDGLQSMEGPEGLKEPGTVSGDEDL